MVKNNKLSFLLILFIFLLFLKVDFRITNDLVCCGDDYDYFAHAATIVEDLDFDYSNQLPDKSRYYKNEKNAPIGFFGTGLLSVPFLALGKLFDFFTEDQSNGILAYEELIYSFSSIFYLFLTLLYIKKILAFKNININKFVLPFFGSGIIYYAFERYSMTHVYEVFSVTMVIYFSICYFEKNEKNNIFSFMLPLFIFITFLVRWTNYYILFIPYIVSKLFFNNNSKSKLFKDSYFMITSIISIFSFALLSKAIYGVITFSPTYVYMEDDIVSELATYVGANIFTTFFNVFKDIINILFTKEFGIFWFSPIIFIGFFVTVISLFSPKEKQRLPYLLVFLSYIQCFFIVSYWGSTASSYGFRYLFSLIPLSIFVLVINIEITRFNIINVYLKYFSIFSILSILFFESTFQTQLSLVPVLNSFDTYAIYSQPEYLPGILKSFIVMDSYLKIFATSFLGAIIFKLFITFFGKEALFSLVSKVGMNNTNPDFIELIDKLKAIDIDKFVFVLIFVMLIVYFFKSRIINNKIST